MQPSCHSIITGAHPCPLYAIGLRQPLTGEDLQQVSRMMDSLISQEDTFRLAVSERNESEEERLCNTPAQLLSVVEARQVKNLLYQLENILGIDGFRTRHGLPFVRRQARLHKAIYGMPFSLVQEFHLEERLSHAEILQDCFQTAILNYEFASLESRTRLQEKAAEFETTMDPQIQSLLDLLGATADNPDFSSRWVELRQAYFSELRRFTLMVANRPIQRANDHMMDWEYEYDENDEDEKMRRLAAVRSLVHSGRLADLTNVDPECPICKEEISQPNTGQEFPTRLACGHVFDSECLTRLLCEKNSCPSCRRKYGRIL
ncbi:hypothetical protein L207DRAFT_528239 [Hyaloscypha variabilis F]|uniref:RING-type domain-containing protein n=1 Tax=Hyaloscypha variabilis (strain UAMH 11265 / GT02V1 / F) TaxID=1149755 RepID=A0A2J6RSZ3_HYAVF|nr:hypothetical protein L207DRAFT_528239 [Hyaloscypha variabilis F]